LFFVDDLAYYVFHRVSHETRLFWNFHVVHHSSKQYNLSVAVRQSWFSGILHWMFYAPVMLLGFAPWMFLLVHGFNLIYQFWIHTKLIRSLGPLEWVLNTPSHHRVHHGVNNPYLDKNYAGVLIIWDRMFGSFVKETEEPQYGIIKQIDGYNPFWINTHGWVEMWDAIREQPTFWRKLSCIFGSPNMEFDETTRGNTSCQLKTNMQIAKLPFIAITTAMFTFAICAQSVVVTKRTVTYRRPNPQMGIKRTFVINYAKVKAASPAIAAKIERQLSYFKLFQFTLREEINESHWLSEADFEVDHNANGLLSIALTVSGVGAYPDDSTQHIVLNSRTGARLVPVGLFDDLSSLAAKADKKLQDEIRAAKKKIKEDKESSEMDVEELFDGKKFDVGSLNEYSVNKAGITFYYDYGFPHVIESLRPGGEIKFSWTEIKSYIKPGGLLAVFIR
jgi:hypothetical protein